MRLEDQVCSFEQSVKFRELGVQAFAYWRWKQHGDDNPYLFVNDAVSAIWLEEEKCNIFTYQAYTVAEMMMMLNKYSNWEFVDLCESQAKYLGDIIINEITDGYIDPKELKL